MADETLQTTRLRLVPHEPAHLRALLESEESYADASGMAPAAGLRDFLISKDVSAAWLEALRKATSPDPWTYGFALVNLETNTVIGNASFTGPPGEDGVAEIAHGIVPRYEGRGYATEAAGALIRFAERSGQVRLLRAHTLPQTNASTRVLSKCGFVKAGEIVDSTDGLIWRWERNVTPR